MSVRNRLAPLRSANRKSLFCINASIRSDSRKSAPVKSVSMNNVPRASDRTKLASRKLASDRSQFFRRAPSKLALSRSRLRKLHSSSKASRSEEHTSELQSLMRISYAVFCLQKKHNEHHDNNPDNHTQ